MIPKRTRAIKPKAKPIQKIKLKQPPKQPAASSIDFSSSEGVPGLSVLNLSDLLIKTRIPKPTKKIVVVISGDNGLVSAGSCSAAKMQVVRRSTGAFFGSGRVRTPAHPSKRPVEGFKGLHGVIGRRMAKKMDQLKSLGLNWPRNPVFLRVLKFPGETTSPNKRRRKVHFFRWCGRLLAVARSGPNG